jgi:hypothetical protein
MVPAEMMNLPRQARNGRRSQSFLKNKTLLRFPQVGWRPQGLHQQGSSDPEGLGGEVVRTTSFLRCHFILKRLFYQDRLGTNIGQVETKGVLRRWLPPSKELPTQIFFNATQGGSACDGATRNCTTYQYLLQPANISA